MTDTELAWSIQVLHTVKGRTKAEGSMFINSANSSRFSD